MPDPVHFAIRDRIGILVIDNPPVNALGSAVWAALDLGIAQALADSAADAIVVMGAGSTFVAGADIRVFDTLLTTADSLRRSTGIHAILRRIEDSPKPVIAAIHGNALGGGNELAMACHYRIAAAGSKFGQPEVLLGLIPGAAGTQRLPRLVGPELAMRMCTEGKPISVAEALSAGLIDALVDDDLQKEAIRFASTRTGTRRTRDLTGGSADESRVAAAAETTRARLAEATTGSRAPYAALEAVRFGIEYGFDAGSVRERELFAACVLTDESKALRHQFFAKRQAAKGTGVTSDTPNQGREA